MAENLFSKEDKARIIDAIVAAEKETSGEIQVHLEERCKVDVLDRAANVFETLKMHKTAGRNGVLFYLAMTDHKFAILGDAGINQVVPENFWDEIKEEMLRYFKQGQYTDGLCRGIEMAAQQLKTHFPYDPHGDENELPDEISFG